MLREKFNGLQKCISHGKEVRWDWIRISVQKIGIYLGYASRAFGTLSSQVNEDISEKPDFASNQAKKRCFLAVKLNFRVVALWLLKIMMF